MAACQNSGLWLLHWRNSSLKRTLNTVPRYCIRKKYWQEPTNTFKIHNLLLLKTKLTNEASESNRPQEKHKLEMEWRYQLVLFLAVRISTVSAATVAASGLKQNLRHVIKKRLTWHTKETANWMFWKRLLSCLWVELQNQLALLKNSPYFFLRRWWVQEKLTHVRQHNHLSKIWSGTDAPSILRPKIFSLSFQIMHTTGLSHSLFNNQITKLLKKNHRKELIYAGSRNLLTLNRRNGWCHNVWYWGTIETEYSK